MPRGISGRKARSMAGGRGSFRAAAARVEWWMKEWAVWTCWWGLLACGALSLLPFQLARRWRSWPLYLPVAGGALYGTLESAWLGGRAGWIAGASILGPLMMFLWVNGMVKMGLLRVWMAWTGGSRRRLQALPQRRLLLVLALPVLACCASWQASLDPQAGRRILQRVVQAAERAPWEAPAAADQVTQARPAQAPGG